MLLSGAHTSTKAADVTKLKGPVKNRTSRYISFFFCPSLFYFRYILFTGGREASDFSVMLFSVKPFYAAKILVSKY